jgi:glycine/D-amino acid oxidase-like deaminating enzyme
MKDSIIGYGALSYWHDTAPTRPRSHRVEAGSCYDVAIVGGGFTGLWTAYHLLAQNPSLEVAIFEREEVGFGASGRNGGFAMTKIGHSLHQMVRDYGAERALSVQLAAEAAVQGLAATAEEEGIDCELRYGGLVTVATNQAQERKIRRDLAAAEQLGIDSLTSLDADQVHGVARSPTYRIGIAEKHCAVLHPAKLVRGLADVVVKRGGVLFERSGPASVADEGSRVRIDCPEGPVYADHAVISTNAWAAHDPRFGRQLVPMYTYLIATEPIGEDGFAKIGWTGWQGIEDKRVNLHYYRKTLDGRILWGGRDNTITFGSEISPRHDRNERIFGLLRESFARTFPPLAGVRFTHGWGGPIAITPDFLPKFGSLSERLHYGWGYCGHGVGPSYLGGQILTDLVSGKKTERTELLFVEKLTGHYPREPIRFVGAQLARLETLWYDDGAEVGKDLTREPVLLRLATSLFGR